MKKFVIIALLITPLNAFAKDLPQKNIQLIEGEPSKPYSIISPVSADKKRADQAVNAIKKNAAKMGADAIIRLECQSGHTEKVGAYFMGLIPINARINSVCHGIAVKWSPNSNQEDGPIQKEESPEVIAAAMYIRELFEKDGFLDKNGQPLDMKTVEKIVNAMEQSFDKMGPNFVPSKKDVNNIYKAAKKSVLAEK